MRETSCPACHSQFPARRHRVYGGLRELLVPPHLTVDRQLEDASLVRCPSCGHQFVSEHVGLFGVRGLANQRKLVGLYVFAFLCVVGYLVYDALRHG
jgi:ribosomal protein L32